MRGQVLFLVVFSLAQTAHAAESSAELAKQAEEAAFAAVNENRWCDAANQFLLAQAYAPNFDLVFNAAQAAALAGDRKQAVKLYAELLDAYPDSDSRDGVGKALAEVTQIIQTEGPGEPCPALTPPGASSSSTSSEGTSSTAPDRADDDAHTADAPSVGEEAISAPAQPIWPWAMAGGGGALAVTGAVFTAVGVMPALRHADAREQIVAAEAAGADASAAQVQQLRARADWEGWGEMTTYTGAALLVTGVVVSGVGVIVGLTQGPDEETPAEAPPAGRPADVASAGAAPADATPADAAVAAEDDAAPSSP